MTSSRAGGGCRRRFWAGPWLRGVGSHRFRGPRGGGPPPRTAGLASGVLGAYLRFRPPTIFLLAGPCLAPRASARAPPLHLLPRGPLAPRALPTLAPGPPRATHTPRGPSGWRAVAAVTASVLTPTTTLLPGPESLFLPLWGFPPPNVPHVRLLFPSSLLSWGKGECPLLVARKLGEDRRSGTGRRGFVFTSATGSETSLPHRSTLTPILQFRDLCGGMSEGRGPPREREKKGSVDASSRVLDHHLPTHFTTTHIPLSPPPAVKKLRNTIFPETPCYTLPFSVSFFFS